MKQQLVRIDDDFPLYVVDSLFMLSYYVSLRYEFRVVRSIAISTQWCSVRLYLQTFIGDIMSYLRYLC